MECLAMYEDEWLALYVILVFVAFISGMFVGALISPNRRKEREPWHARFAAVHARLAAAKARPRRDVRQGSANLLAVVTALVVVFGVIVLDHFRGPLFPDLFYCLTDDGTQITGKCTGRRGVPVDTATDIRGRATLPE
jgi:hypothetical protein